MCFGLLAKEHPEEGFEESLAAIFGVVNELEEAEVERKTLLGDAAVRPEPGAQQGPEAFEGVDVNLVEAVAVFIAGLLPSAVADGLVRVAPRPQAGRRGPTRRSAFRRFLRPLRYCFLTAEGWPW